MPFESQLTSTPLLWNREPGADILFSVPVLTLAVTLNGVGG